ncbi:type II secretion system protein [Roseimaritima ulvae]|uniref:Type II secretion system protein G n=1 Tax=Roseimaritima ulvae TaxID=980254 RepID=A0A5B9QX90_9BACT|nr:prepilin-type N-terminal cleavage/methylation domain-containing protein [Roseimaritima ulvae]QEG38581.1 hypothetical protein UC8_05380 [Roseimaritima ulvae]
MRNSHSRSYRRQTVDPSAADPTHALASVATSHARRRGLTLVEVLTVMVVLSILLSMSVSPLRQTVEQTHADIAGAGLRSLYNAQRFYWLEHRSYADSIVELRDAGLIDADYLTATEAATAPPSVRYQYEIVSADASGFVARAVRRGSGDWSGNYQIDQTGAMSGAVSNAAATTTLTPGF